MMKRGREIAAIFIHTQVRHPSPVAPRLQLPGMCRQSDQFEPAVVAQSHGEAESPLDDGEIVDGDRGVSLILAADCVTGIHCHAGRR
jgi:hypothetical protein